MNILVDRAERSVSLTAPRKTYSDDAVRITAHVFFNRAEVYHGTSSSDHKLKLVAKRLDADQASLEALGGEFLNELLNQEYRFVVARFNRKVADIITAQTLMSARGGEKPAEPVPDSAEVEAEAKKLMAAAAAEIRSTMPKKIAPQGPLYPPEDHGR